MESSPTDSQSQEKQTYIAPQLKNNYRAKLIAIVLVVFVVFDLGIFLWMQFFSKSKTSNTPQVANPPSQITQALSPTAALTQITLPCPSVPQFCKQGVEVTDGVNMGIAETVDAESPIYAVFDGKITFRTATPSLKSGRETLTQLSLVTPDGKMTAIYYIYYVEGSVVLKSSYKKGDEIGKVPKEKMKYFNNTNLAFFLLDDDQREIPLKSIMFNN